ncbi:glycosyltransferase [Brumimicrobium glaciale]|uniref:Glycosyltransferase n=1 Tax=Brumimicrobium glaciale TaxID=200475 RepID=A0A4Q4KPS2_9FLAO|nr:glycosyltransferase [Brumimicrobium glaciale]RYM34009.1 glycosyltransferase [Brumimicrobium glaciale]
MNKLYKARTVILIPHYNNLKGLEKSIESVNHSQAIDILIIDDGSTSSQVPDLLKLQKISTKNSKIILFLSKKNEGISSALNRGLDIILELNQYEFIARLDCGDTCVVNRFFLQEKYFDKNDTTMLVGSWAKWIDQASNNEVFKFKPAVDHKKIMKMMSVRCNFIHPTVMFRTSVVKELGKYPDQYTDAEDYAYFFNISKNYKTANIPKYLTNVDYNIEGISVKNRKSQNRSKIKVINAYGKKDIYQLYGFLYNFLLLVAPAKLVFLLKKKVFS